MCGSTRAMDPWSSIASHYGTMIILSADLPCEGRPGTRWPKDVSLIQARIDKALAVVKSARGGLLDTDHLALIGYSQGAHRGEGLAGMYPDRYEYLILGGSPEAPSPQNLAKSRSVAIVGGEREDVSHMRAGDEALRRAGVRSKFFLLPRAAHGDYGPQGPEVLARVFAWMFDEAP
jgi:pimeloyl-ACP methyl ester carboxylesterase